MIERKQHWIISSWAIAIWTPLITFLSTMFWDFIKKKPILTSFGVGYTWLRSEAIFILNFQLKVWWILVGILIIIVIYGTLDKIINKEDQEPDFYHYTTDLFKSQKWTWVWLFNSKQKNWYISNIRVHCPACDTTMMQYMPGSYKAFRCPRCDFEGDHLLFSDINIINHLILDNIERKRNSLPKLS